MFKEVFVELKFIRLQIWSPVGQVWWLIGSRHCWSASVDNLCQRKNLEIIIGVSFYFSLVVKIVFDRNSHSDALIFLFIFLSYITPTDLKLGLSLYVFCFKQQYSKIDWFLRYMKLDFWSIMLLLFDCSLTVLGFAKVMNDCVSRVFYPRIPGPHNELAEVVYSRRVNVDSSMSCGLAQNVMAHLKSFRNPKVLESKHC